jgi:hypothetical protein
VTGNTCTPSLHNSVEWQPKRKKTRKTILLVAAGTASCVLLFREFWMFPIWRFEKLF